MHSHHISARLAHDRQAELAAAAAQSHLVPRRKLAWRPTVTARVLGRLAGATT